MKCENLFCIYQSGDYCTLDCTELDIQGQCKECIYPDIDNTVLSEIKAKHLEKCYKKKNTGRRFRPVRLSNNPKSQARFGAMNFNLWKFKQKQANEPYM